MANCSWAPCTSTSTTNLQFTFLKTFSQNFLTQSAMAQSSNFKVEHHYQPDLYSPCSFHFYVLLNKSKNFRKCRSTSMLTLWSAVPKIPCHLSIAIKPQWFLRVKVPLAWELPEKALPCSKVILSTLSNMLLPSPFSSNGGCGLNSPVTL